MKNFKTHKNLAKFTLLWIALLSVFASGCGDSTAPNSQEKSPTSQEKSAPSQNKGTASKGPEIKGVGTGCDDKYCIWILGSNFAPNSVVELRKSDNPGQVIAKYTELTVSTQGADQLLTVAVKEQDAKNAMNSPGVKVRVINPENNLYSDSEPVIRQSGK